MSIKNRIDGFLSKVRSAQGNSATPFQAGFVQSLSAGLLVLLLFAGIIQFRSGMMEPSIKTDSVTSITINFPKAGTPPKAASSKKLPGKQLVPARAINALPPAPVEGLTEIVDGKTVPISRLQDDLTPFAAYKKSYASVAGRHQIALVAVDYGLSAATSQKLLDSLPDTISFTLSPYSSDATKWAAAARAYGHEFWLTLPMQSIDGDNGPLALQINEPLEEMHKRLMTILGSVTGYAGIVTAQDHSFKNDDVSAPSILKQLFGRGLAVAESNPDRPAFGLTMAMESGYPYVQNTFWIDTDLNPQTLDKIFAGLETQAILKDRTVAFFHPYPALVERISQWAKSAEAKNIDIVPLSAAVRQ